MPFEPTSQLKKLGRELQSSIGLLAKCIIITMKLTKDKPKKHRGGICPFPGSIEIQAF